MNKSEAETVNRILDEERRIIAEAMVILYERCERCVGHIDPGEPDSPHYGWWVLARARNAFCAHCGAAAVCVGSYEDSPTMPGCDACCDHGQEDGVCVPMYQEKMPAVVLGPMRFAEDAMSLTITTTTAVEHESYCQPTAPSPDRPNGGCICGRQP